MMAPNMKGTGLAQPLVGDSPPLSNSWTLQRPSLSPRTCLGVCCSGQGSSAAGAVAQLCLLHVSQVRVHSLTNALALCDSTASKKHLKALLSGDTR